MRGLEESVCNKIDMSFYEGRAGSANIGIPSLPDKDPLRESMAYEPSRSRMPKAASSMPVVGQPDRAPIMVSVTILPHVTARQSRRWWGGQSR